MTLFRMIALSLGLGISATSALAEYQPRSSSHDRRVRVASYQDGQVYRLHTSLTRVTSVEFDEGETIRSIIAGDTEGFELDGVPGGEAFAVKPTARGVSTNITVYTDRRSYYFSVTESPSPTYFAVRFTYPSQVARPQTVAVTQRTMNRSYGTSAQREFTPLVVWDDGRFTYFRFRPGAPVPAIFRWSDGKERTVNSTAQGEDVIRVSGTSDRWVLRMGEAEVCIQKLGRAGAGT